MTHTEFGPKVLSRIMEKLQGEAEQDREQRMEGKRFTTVLKTAKGQGKQEAPESSV